MNQFDLGVSQDWRGSQVVNDLVDLLTTVGIVALVYCSSFSDAPTSCLCACVRYGTRLRLFLEFAPCFEI